jgi:hypothetical protein
MTTIRQKPQETTGNSWSPSVRKVPATHAQIIASISLTENRGVGSSILPLAIA